MAVQTRTDRRFRRAQVKPSRRRRAEATRRVVAGAVVLSVLALGGFVVPDLIRTAPFLHIDTIVVEGHVRVAEGEVLALVDRLRGQNLLLADLEVQRDALLTLGWIEAATLKRILPSTVAISIVEHEPAGFARFGGRLYLIDRNGTVIEEHGPRFADVNLPIVDGLAVDGGTTVDLRRAELASNLITALASDRELAMLVSQIGVGDPYDAVVLLNDGPTVIHLGQERFVERLRRYVELAPTLRDYVPEIDYVDMRFEKRVVVRSAKPGESGPLVASSRTRSVSIQ